MSKMDHFKRRKRITVSLSLIIFAYAMVLAVFLDDVERKMCFIAMALVWLSDYYIYRDIKRNNDKNYVIGTIIFILSQMILIVYFAKKSII